MNDIQIFNNADFGQIRTMIIDGEPWFVGKDVANILGYRNGSRDINRHVDEDDRHKVMIFDGNQNKETITINESGLYSLVLSSKLDTAKKFKRWVTSDVLPSIRKTGSYSVIQDSYLIEDPIKRAERWIEEQKVRLALETKVSQQKPMVDVAEQRIDKKGCLTITDATRAFGLKSGQITNWAKEKGYLHRGRQEVNKSGLGYFKVYSEDFVHNTIGVLDSGMELIRIHIEEIKSTPSRIRRNKGE